MKSFTDKDRKKLNKQGLSEKEIDGIEKTLPAITFHHPTASKKIRETTARKLLGDDIFLNGLAACVAYGRVIRHVKGNTVGFCQQEKERAENG